MAATGTATARHRAEAAGEWECAAPFELPALVRVSADGGATRAELVRDLRFLAPQLAQPRLRAVIEEAIGQLVADHLVAGERQRFRPTEAGLERLVARHGLHDPGTLRWADLRDGPLTALSLGLSPADRSVLKGLSTTDGLRGLVVQAAFGLGDGRPMSLSRLRAALAVRALERAFGHQIKASFGTGGGLAAKPSRLLAGQLSCTPKDFGTDGRLVAALAAEHLGLDAAEPDALRAALIRRFSSELAARSAPQPATNAAPAAPGEKTARAAPIANDPGRAGERPLPAARPDLAGFVRHVQAAAARRAEGWPGNRKAFISHVWQEIKSAHPSWALSEIEFKGMLAEAHRIGGLVLANADLKDKKNMQEFENSAIQYKNTVWHFVRVEE